MDKVVFNCTSGDGSRLDVGKLGEDDQGAVWLRTNGGRPVHLDDGQLQDLLMILKRWER